MNVQTSRLKLRVISRSISTDRTYQALYFKVQTSLQISLCVQGGNNRREGEGCASLDCQMMKVKFAKFNSFCPPLNRDFLYKELTTRQSVLAHKTRVDYYNHMEYIHFPIHNFKSEFLWGLDVRPDQVKLYFSAIFVFVC
jgi:hypothetical protein